MMRRLLVLSAIVLCAGVACEDDSVTPPPPPPPDPKLEVLSGLERTYNRRQISKYEELLDENFTFYLFSGDVVGDVPPQWGRQEELDANLHLFDPNFVDPDPSDGIQEPCEKILMDVKWEDGVQWQESPQAAESWYIATVFYNFQFDVGANDHYINNPDSRAQFTVRNAGTEDAPVWKLVEMRDLDTGSVPLSSRPVALKTLQATWGHVKALYR